MDISRVSLKPVTILPVNQKPEEEIVSLVTNHSLPTLTKELIPPPCFELVGRTFTGFTEMTQLLFLTVPTFYMLFYKNFTQIIEN